MPNRLILATCAMLAATTALAGDYRVGDIAISHVLARSTPEGATVSAGYMTIRNAGSQADTLIGASVDFAGRVEIHEMTMDGDVMKMRELAAGLEIPAGGEVKLMPGGYHVMFMELKQPLIEGEEHVAELAFEHAGTVEVTLNVDGLDAIRQSLGADGMTADHSEHGGMKTSQ